MALLQPLADLMDVTISELLRGQRIQAETPLTAQEADRLVSGALHLTVQEQAEQREIRRRWALRYALGVLVLAVELLFLWRVTGYLTDNLASMLLTPPAAGRYFRPLLLFLCQRAAPRLL